MKPVGYSGTPLPKKLGLAAGSRLCVHHGPSEFPTWLEPLPENVRFVAPNDEADVTVLFVTEQAVLIEELPKLMSNLVPRGGLWIAWPKKSSKVPTDIVEDTLREIILPLGWVDNKVCAISETWSGLRFVRRQY